MRAHAKKGTPTALPTGSKLTNEQWEQVVDWVRSGESIRQAAALVKVNFGITIAPSAIAANKLVQRYRADQRLESAEQAAATLHSKVGVVADVVVGQIDILQKERDKLRKDLDKIKRDGPEEDGMTVNIVYARLAKVEDELRKTVDTFNKLYASSKDTGGLSEKLKEQDEAEADAAITQLLDTLRVKLSSQSEADMVLDARLARTNETYSDATTGETRPSS